MSTLEDPAAGVSWLTPDWPAPQGVHAASTTRAGGVSRAPYASLNLGAHVGDDPAAVAVNRVRLRQHLKLPDEPRWIGQVHGAAVVDAVAAPEGCPADGAYSLRPGVVCAVLTADCLPLLLCARDATRVAAVHAGWRGLAVGVIEAAVDALGVPGEDILAWLGPAIGPRAFEVGDEVRQLFLRQDRAAEQAFQPSPAGRWWADIYRLARQRLHGRDVHGVYGGGWCTYRDAGRFFSYRRDGVTGRMASLIWIEQDA